MKYNRPLTPSQIEDITILDDQNTPFSEIASQTEIPIQAVQAHLLTRERIAKDYNTAMSVSTIYNHYGINVATYYALLTEHNIPRRRTTSSSLYNKSMPSSATETAHLRLSNLNRAVEMYESGEKIFTITSQTGINQPTLHAHLRRLNIPFRRIPHTNNSPALSPDDLTLAQELRMKGVPLARIARDMKISTHNLRLQLAKVSPE